MRIEEGVEEGGGDYRTNIHFLLYDKQLSLIHLNLHFISEAQNVATYASTQLQCLPSVYPVSTKYLHVHSLVLIYLGELPPTVQ